MLAWLSRKNSCPDCRTPCCKYITMGLKVYKNTAELVKKLDEQLLEKFKGYENDIRRVYKIGTYTLDSRYLMKKKNAKKEFEKILQDNINHKILIDNMVSDDWCYLVKRIFRFGNTNLTPAFLDGLNDNLDLLQVSEKQLMNELLRRSIRNSSQRRN
jgi:hypothetical protein